MVAVHQNFITGRARTNGELAVGDWGAGLGWGEVGWGGGGGVSSCIHVLAEAAV